MFLLQFSPFIASYYVYIISFNLAAIKFLSPKSQPFGISSESGGDTCCIYPQFFASKESRERKIKDLIGLKDEMA